MEKYLATYGKPRFLGIVKLNGEERDSAEKDRLVVVQSHRGEELAEIVGTLDEEQESEYRSLRTISEHGEGQVRGGDPVVTDLDFMRSPSADDLATHESQSVQEGENLRIAQELVNWHNLSIKLIDDEMLLDGKKLFFYFTSEQRVDFRTLVRDLARRFRTRIELRQMGVRDEARIIRGISSCGLPCCCSYWLNQFAPIGIKMVKEQNIALNPSKISGICGRLMCCMSFEHRVYREMWTGLPGPGSKIKTPNGNYIVQSLDIARNAVRCHKPTGGDIAVPKDLFADFRQAVMNGDDWDVPEEARERMNALRGHCSSCRAKPFGIGIDGAVCPQPYQTAASETSDSAPEQTVEKPDEDGDQAKKNARRRASRRRNRRGKRPSTEGTAQTVQAAQTAPKKQEGRRLEHQERQMTQLQAKARLEGAEKALPGASLGKDADKRSKRRRRRPKRPAGDEE